MSYVCLYHNFFHPLSVEHWNSFQFGAITNTVAVNIPVHIFAEHIYAFLLGIDLEGGFMAIMYTVGSL